jgi:DNA invertase Pin-like site-specific DNA recombinase
VYKALFFLKSSFTQFIFMKSAYLYVRVSTDEQAKRGYSLREQEERLRNYCDTNDIEIKDIYREDCSAKTFDRPVWAKLLNELKKQKNKKERNTVLFIKWDRFSRNVEAAYQMIGTLRLMNTDAIAIDQPVDFTIPESKVILSVYLTIPEVENDRRALNTFYGMRRARKEGRWMGSAPTGYINRITPDGKKYIMPKPKESELMKWVFEELAKGVLVAEQVRKLANEKGLKCERNNFWRLIRNPIYCGYIVVPPHENEELEFVKGQHEAIISKTLFYEVQDILNGNQRAIATKSDSVNMLPLRGFLKCPLFHRMLTGSGSKGRNGRYYYYHCSSVDCKCRFKAEDVNLYFETDLLKYKLEPAAGELFKMVVIDEFRSSNREELDERRNICKQIEEQETILSTARRKLMKEEIESDDFNITKKECNTELRKLEEKLNELPMASQNLKTLESLLEIVVEKYTNIDERYAKAEIDEKRAIIGSM